MKWRIGSLISFFGVLYIALVFQLYNLQFKKNALYEAKAESQQVASGVLQPNRGNVYVTDKNGNRIQAIMNKEFSLIYAVPKEVSDPDVVALNVSKILGLSQPDVKAMLVKTNDQYELLKFKATNEEVDAIKKLDARGIYIKKQQGRFYPLGTLVSHVLGYVGPVNEEEKKEGGYSEKGMYGIEKQFNEELMGSMGKVKGDRIVYPQDGRDIVLTIDRNIQAQGEEIIRNLVEKWGAKSGTVIVQEPKTGKTNNYKEAEMKDFINIAVQSLYEPGSVMKPITMSAGIDSGKITPDTAYNDTGSVTLNKRTIKNWDLKAYGRTTMTGVIEHSLNVGTVFAQQQMGDEIFKDYFLNRYTFGEKTGIALPGERDGNVSPLKSGQAVNYATAAFGQGIAVTPLKMVSVMSAIANHGVLMKPLILADEEPQEVRRVISEDAARKVAEMMVSAVYVNKLAEIPKYQVAGKTGTAYVPNFGGRGYSDDVVNTYEGFAPAYDPKFVILIKVERPKGAPLAGQTVVPAFKELSQFILNYYNIAPDKPSER
ncbi:MAG: Peptidoglycan glycosyltransferase [Candidatus Wolfebacteria bacterium GW2011_GWA1_47_6]|nr:MAG: Peptidoglycan glycosyltransferase [Candidatus Wolfebacteria bacterium GW2011_GWA1_47_6]